MRVPLGDLAQFGVNKDREGYNLPVEAWTDARNVRFHEGKLARVTGHLEALAGHTETSHWLMHVLDANGGSHWIVADLDKVSEFSSGAYSDITKAATTYGATADRLWNGGVLGNIPVINNGVEVPQMWSPVSAGQRLVDLTNWPATHRCAMIKPFKNFLFAIDLTISATRFGHRVLISHPAAPGAVPSSWDATDATKDVFTQEVGSVDAGFLVDMAPMRDFMVLYKERSTHGAQFIGGRDKWRIFPIFEALGVFQPDCVCAFAQNSMHAMMSGDDIVIHNGQTPQFLLPERLRRWLAANIDTSTYARSFCVHNQQETEVWFCIPLVGATWPTLAIVWNYTRNTFTFRELEGFSHIAGGQIPLTTSDDWDSDNASWDSDESRWDEFTHPPFIRRLLAANPTTSKLHHLDFGNTFNGTEFTASVEKFGFDLIGITRDGTPVRDREAFRFVKRVYFQAKGSPFQVQLGMQNEIEDTVFWSTPETFTPGQSKFVDFEDAKATQLFGLRIFSTSGGAWEVSGIEFDIERCGEF